MSVEEYHELFDWHEALEAKHKYGDIIFHPEDAPDAPDGSDGFFRDCKLINPAASHPLGVDFGIDTSRASTCLSEWLPRLRLMLVLRLSWVTAWNLHRAFVPFLGRRSANDLSLSAPITTISPTRAKRLARNFSRLNYQAIAQSFPLLAIFYFKPGSYRHQLPDKDKFIDLLRFYEQLVIEADRKNKGIVFYFL